jgi:hypothetical protein
MESVTLTREERDWTRRGVDLALCSPDSAAAAAPPRRPHLPMAKRCVWVETKRVLFAMTGEQ